MWEDRDALAALDLPGRDRILDVGCGTGEFTRVLREESGATVIGLDADPTVLAHVSGRRVLGSALALPFVAGSFDLAACQALLVNLDAVEAAVAEFARVSRDLVAAVEPNNADVVIDSTVDGEADLAGRAREAFIEGVGTDVTMGADAADVFRTVGLSEVVTRQYRHTRSIEPPYAEAALRGAARRASGGRLDDHRATLLAGGVSETEYDDLRTAWRATGRRVIKQMRADEYERVETVPFYVTVGRV